MSQNWNERACGCTFEGSRQRDPTLPCPDAEALKTALDFAELLVVTAPDNFLSKRVAAMMRAALDSHYKRNLVPQRAQHEAAKPIILAGVRLR